MLIDNEDKKIKKNIYLKIIIFLSSSLLIFIHYYIGYVILPGLDCKNCFSKTQKRKSPHNFFKRKN